MKKSIRFKTNFFISVIIVFGLAVIAVIGRRFSQRLLTGNREQIVSLASEGISLQIDSFLSEPISVATAIAGDKLLNQLLEQENSQASGSAFPQLMQDYLDVYREKYGYERIFLITANNSLYYSSDGQERDVLPGTPESDWFRRALTSSEKYIIRAADGDKSENIRKLYISSTIKGQTAEPLGLVGIEARIDGLQTIFQAYEQEYGVSASLSDAEGNLLISSSPYSSSDTGGITFSSRCSLFPDWYVNVAYNASYLPERGIPPFYASVSAIISITAIMILTIFKLFHRYHLQLTSAILEEEKRHHSVFQTETEKIYENIYEIDVTHNRAASESTEQYFESLGVPKESPFDQALRIIASSQIKEEYRQGYLTAFDRENVLEAYRCGNDSLRYEFMISGDGGQHYHWMRITARIFYWDEDQSVRMFIYRQNIEAEKRHEKFLFEKMESDSLTGLYNKAATQQHIQRFLEEQPDKGYVFYILDIDDFKSINDTCGHAAGDNVITDFARLLKEQFGPDDIVGRIGGDEFAAFLPSPSRDWAERKAQRLCLELHHEYMDSEFTHTISASIGAALSPEDGHDFEMLYRNADIALYQTKARGKNGFTLYQAAELIEAEKN